jgi:hypothetical protein
LLLPQTRLVLNLTPASIAKLTIGTHKLGCYKIGPKVSMTS